MKEYITNLVEEKDLSIKSSAYLDSIDWQVADGLEKNRVELQKSRVNPIDTNNEARSIVLNAVEIASRYGSPEEVLRHIDIAFSAHMNPKGLVNLSYKMAGFANRERKLASNTQFIFEGFKQRLEDALNNHISTGEEKWRR